MFKMAANKLPVFLLIIFCFVLLACTRSAIEFGDTPSNVYTSIVYSDTVKVNLSTVLIDSFETGGATSLLLGRYADPFLGKISARPFIQFTPPALSYSIPATAQYDSTVLILYPNGYYYGDTTIAQTISVNELANHITLGYNEALYNTSNVSVKPVPLGTSTVRIAPGRDDSIRIKLSDALGSDLYAKMVEQSTIVLNSEEFRNYFMGVSISAGNADGAVYGLTTVMALRIYYHTSFPSPESKYIDFPSLQNEYTFNQILIDRSGTGLNPGLNGLTEIHSSLTGDRAFLQPGTGTFLKMNFPSLRNILASDKVIHLLKAELIIRPATNSFNASGLRLPSSTYLVQTDESNLWGSEVVDSTGQGVQQSTPVVDFIYGENTYYRFDVTAYINNMMNTQGSEDFGFYVLHDFSGGNINVSRLVVNNALHGAQSSSLRLQFLVIN